MKLKLGALATALLLLAACSSTSDSTTGATAGGAVQPGGLGGSGVAASELAGRGTGNIQPGSQQDLEVNVGDRVFFGFDSAVVDDAARQTLERQAAWLKQFPSLTVQVEGHADERGTTEYNLALGERRASAVKSYLTTLGVEPSRLLTISYGKERPADPGHNEQAWALNRRAVTVVNVTQ